MDDDLSMYQWLATKGCWEVEVTSAICGIVHDGAVCVDVGACFGYYSCLMRELAGANGQVIAFEPNALTAECCQLSLCANGWQHNVTVIEKACGRISGRGRLVTTPYRVGSSHVIAEDFAEVGEDRLQETSDVDVTTLDSELTRIGVRKVDVVKIDVEGFELDVLAGAMEMVKQHKPRLVVEIHKAAIGHAVYDKLRWLGYKAWLIGIGGLSLASDDELWRLAYGHVLFDV